MNASNNVLIVESDRDGYILLQKMIAEYSTKKNIIKIISDLGSLEQGKDNITAGKYDIIFMSRKLSGGYVDNVLGNVLSGPIETPIIGTSCDENFMKTFKLLSLPKPLNYKDLEKIIKSLENESLTAERTESRKNLMNTLNAKENKQLKSTHKKRRGMG